MGIYNNIGEVIGTDLPSNVRSSYHLCFEYVADFVYISESNESLEKYLTQRW